MLLNKNEQSVIDFDVKSEIVAKDKFFERAKQYITTDQETLLQRQSLFSDILHIDGLSDFLTSLSEKLTEFAPLMKVHPTSNNEDRIRSVLYPTIYIELVRFININLASFQDDITSKSLKDLYALAENDLNSDEYRRLERYYEKNTAKLRSINSVTIGVNLDALYQPTEAGIISLNQEKFRSGNLLDRIFKMDFEKNGNYCIAPITVLDKKLDFHESQQVNYAFLKAMEKVMDCGLRHCNTRSLNYLRERLVKYFEYLDSLNFIIEAINHIKIFKEKNIPLCFPNISHDRSFRVVSLYDNKLCRTKSKKEIVPSTVTLENNVCCYILTGPNSTGKTVFIDSLASAQYYFQLGMPIPAKEASLPICDAIFKISVEEQANKSLIGRFEKECISLSEILKKFTVNSLALIDEAFTSTSVAEAVPIAANFISELCKISGKCVFITHHHELCERLPNMSTYGEKIGYLHTKTDEHLRIYSVQNGKSDFSSDANSIAKKYGLVK